MSATSDRAGDVGSASWSSTKHYRLSGPRGRYVDGDVSTKVAACPACKKDVSGSLGAPAVSTMRLYGQAPTWVRGDVVNVRGYVCHDCRRVLPVPTDAIDTDAIGEPGAKWVRVGAYFGLGDVRAVAVPAGQVER